MPIWLLSFLKSKWAPQIAIGVVMIIALMGARSHYMNVGRDQGRIEATSETAKQIEEMHTQAKADRDESEKRLQTQIDEARHQAEQDHSLFLSLVAQRQQVASQVAGMTPDQVQAQINHALARTPDAGATYTPDEQRRIAGCLTQLPLCEKQVQAKESEAQQLSDQTGKWEAKFDTLNGYTAQLEQWYTQLYNLNPPKYRSVKCLFLWKCGKRTLPVPSSNREMSASRNSVLPQ